MNQLLKNKVFWIMLSSDMLDQISIWIRNIGRFVLHYRKNESGSGRDIPYHCHRVRPHLLIFLYRRNLCRPLESKEDDH